MSKRPASELGNGVPSRRTRQSEEPNEARFGYAGAGPQRNGRKPVVQEQRNKYPAVYYKEGECLKDLAKVLSAEVPLLEVRIPASVMGSSNSQVRARQLWGTEEYTHDSDIVAVLLHTGYYSPALASAPSSISEFRAVIRVLPGRDFYPSKSQNGLRSRAWAADTKGPAYKVEECWVITRNGHQLKLGVSLDGVAAIHATYMPRQTERPMQTRNSGQMERRMRPIPEVTVQYNMVNEPWNKYSINMIADHGLKPNQWTSAQLLTNVLFLETDKDRYELSILDNGTATTAKGFQYRFARCKSIMTLPSLSESLLPLEDDKLHEPLYTPLLWEDLQWAGTGLHIKGDFYQLLRYKFVPRTTPVSPQAAAANGQ